MSPSNTNRLRALRSNLRYYLVAVAAVAAATLLRVALQPVLDDRFPFFIFYLSLISSAWYGTLSSSLLGFVLGGLAADYFFLIPRYTLGPSDLASLEGILTYIVVGLTIVVFADAHKRAALHSQLAQSRLRLALQAANAGIFDWDALSGRMLWSREYYDVAGLDRTVRPSLEAWMSSVHPDERERVRAVLGEALVSGGEQLRLDYRTVASDGKQRWIHARCALYRDPAGRAVRVIGAVLDVSDAKQAELALLRSEKLASTGRLAATMAHEVNNPLEAVTNLIYLAKTQPLSGASFQYLDMADAELKRVSHLVRRTLAFYRENSTPAPLRVAEVLDDAVAIMSHRAEANSVSIKKDYRHADAAIVGIAGELRQVFSNLLANSIDAAAAHGAIRLRVSRSRNWIRVSIADNGCGIPPSAMAHIFEPFFTTKAATGTGLGLWVSRQIVERHGGRIRVRSRVHSPNSGTVFSLFLPLAVAQPQPLTDAVKYSAA